MASLAKEIKNIFKGKSVSEEKLSKSNIEYINKNRLG